MKVVKCANGHFFDKDEFESCPHCSPTERVEDKIREKRGKEKRGKEKRGKEKRGKGKGKGGEIISVENSPDGGTFGLFNDGEEDAPKGGGSRSFKEEQPLNEDVKGDSEDEILEDFGGESEDKEAEKQDEDIAYKEDSPAVIIRTAVAESKGETVAIFNPKNKGTVSANAVVGWLVCAKGIHRKDVFNIVAGKNSIGREKGNQIIISQDESISRDKHAWIVYDHKNRKFIIQPGEKHLSYLNGDAILENKELQAYDKLEFGGGTYIFVPLCGDKFSWKDYMED